MMTKICMKLIFIFTLISELSPLISGVNQEDFHERFDYHQILADGIQKQLLIHNYGHNYVKQAMLGVKVQNEGQRFYLEKILKNREEFLETASVDFNVSEACLDDIRLTINGLLHPEFWAYQIIDASGKIPSGILDLDLVWPGQYDECVNITAVVYDNKYQRNTSIHGAYYRLQIKLPFKMPPVLIQQTALSALFLQELTYGACFPSKCTKSDITGIGNTATEMLRPSLPPSLRNVTHWIQKVDQPHPAKYEARTETVICIILLTILSTFMILGTLYDLFVHCPSLAQSEKIAEPEPTHVADNGIIQDIAAIRNADDAPLFGGGMTLTFRQRLQSYSKLGKVLMSFSMYTNGTKILGTETTPNQIQAVNGIRVMSLGWVILGHTYYFSTALSKNLAVGGDWIQRWSFQALINALFSVDSFFLLSGMLGAYLTLKEMQKKNGKINWLLYYFHRFWRLTPPYMLVIITFIGLFHYWGDGPFWPEYSPGYDQCKKYWWRNLLYIQNFFTVSEQCIGWSWYLANDMQFFIITPLILIPLYRKPLVGYVIIGVLMLEQFIFRGVISVAYSQKMNVPTPENQLTWFNNVYQRPYSRISPYLIGILTGYILWKTDRKVKMPKVVVLIGWAVSLVCVTSVVFGTLEENRGHPNSLQVDGLYNSLSKTTWSLGLAWIIFACNTGYGGIVSEFLSSGLWGPFGRLNYCAYLIHPIVMYVYILNQRYPTYFSDVNMVYLFLAHWMLTYGVSFFVSMAFEAPMIGLEKVLLQRAHRH